MTREGTKIFCCTQSGMGTRRGAPLETYAYDADEQAERFGERLPALLSGATVWIIDADGTQAEWVCATVIAQQALFIR